MGEQRARRASAEYFRNPELRNFVLIELVLALVLFFISEIILAVDKERAHEVLIAILSVAMVGIVPMAARVLHASGVVESLGATLGETLQLPEYISNRSLGLLRVKYMMLGEASERPSRGAQHIRAIWSEWNLESYREIDYFEDTLAQQKTTSRIINLARLPIDDVAQHLFDSRGFLRGDGDGHYEIGLTVDISYELAIINRDKAAIFFPSLGDQSFLLVVNNPTQVDGLADRFERDFEDTYQVKYSDLRDVTLEQVTDWLRRTKVHLELARSARMGLRGPTYFERVRSDDAWEILHDLAKPPTTQLFAVWAHGREDELRDYFGKLSGSVRRITRVVIASRVTRSDVTAHIERLWPYLIDGTYEVRINRHDYLSVAMVMSDRMAAVFLVPALPQGVWMMSVLEDNKAFSPLMEHWEHLKQNSDVFDPASDGGGDMNPAAPDNTRLSAWLDRYQWADTRAANVTC